MLKVFRENRKLRKENEELRKAIKEALRDLKDVDLHEQEHRNHVRQYPVGEGIRKGF